MNKGLAFTLGLILGGAGGGYVVNLILKQKYAQKADEEILACRNAFLDEMKKRRDDAEKVDKIEDKDIPEKAKEALEKYGVEEKKAEEIVEKATTKKEPYPITPEEFQDPSNPNVAKGLKYFPMDNILLREDGSIMALDDMVACIGRNALNDIGKYEPNVVHIRNESWGVDYEIISYDGHYKSE